jgi:hypothetical protein
MGENRNRQEWAYFLFGVWFLCVGRGVILRGGGGVEGKLWFSSAGWTLKAADLG